MWINKADYIQMIEAMEYAKTQLEYVNKAIDYFDKSGISKSVTEAAIKKLKEGIEK